MKPEQSLTPEFARMIFNRVVRIHEDRSIPSAEKADLIFKILHYVYSKWCEYENLIFHTFFGKMAYIGDKYAFSTQSLRILHSFRKHMQQGQPQGQEDAGLCSIYLALKERLEFSDLVFERTGLTNKIKLESYTFREYKPFARVLILDGDFRNHRLRVVDRDQPSKPRIARFNVPGRNDNFNSTIEALNKHFKLPVPASLLRIEIGEDETYIPAGIVLQPDYLVDVTAVSECFQPTGQYETSYLVHKMLPRPFSKYILIGHMANYFLDRLMNEPDLSFKSILSEIFGQAPLQFALVEDAELKDILMALNTHFNHLKETVRNELDGIGIDREKCLIEPTYYSPEYGIQGRLDAFHADDEKKTATILELKSGKPFRPNAYGLNQNHFIQTVLYDLLIKSAYRGIWRPMAYILYSQVDENRLKYAPANTPQQMEALQVRNGIVAIEEQLKKCRANKGTILDEFDARDAQRAGGFLFEDAKLFMQTFRSLSTVERKYLKSFIGFLSREQHISKVGDDSFKDRNGFAALWLNNVRSKEEKFTILTSLELHEIRSSEEPPLLVFKRSDQTNELANFRVGDIVVLYPSALESPVHYQMFKASLIDIGATYLRVRLRSVQRNEDIFSAHKHWNLEHDFLESSFNKQFRNLFEFAKFDARKRAVYLGERPPSKDHALLMPPTSDQSLTQKQRAILDRMKASRDYFLLWGPPGTGKTSIMLRALVKDIYEHTSDSVLVLSYTNRAVDEICEALLSISEQAVFYRIGSRFATGKKYRPFLLRQALEEVESRIELKELLQSKRIFTATISSFLGRKDILSLKSFDWVIIDEAAQILEPYLMGILPYFERVVMIGDHMQLPAVVLQSENDTLIQDDSLNALGITDLRMSLFERLYKRCTQKKWHHAYAQLDRQGRMHGDISRHISAYYYEGSLKIIDHVPDLRSRQSAPVMSVFRDIAHHEPEFYKKRVHFIDARANELEDFQKINRDEAEKVCKLLSQLSASFEQASFKIEADTIGVITPFRAQIALIKQLLQERSPELAEVVTVDTVERYQGGARDIIILSLCSNSAYVFDAVVSKNEHGLDRKLNVALTRAREMLFIVGNRKIISAYEDYRALLEYIDSAK